MEKRKVWEIESKNNFWTRWKWSIRVDAKKIYYIYITFAACCKTVQNFFGRSKARIYCLADKITLSLSVDSGVCIEECLFCLEEVGSYAH